MKERKVKTKLMNYYNNYPYNYSFGVNPYLQQQRGNSRYYTEKDWDMYPISMRDSREGKSPLRRKNYMEAKELHQGKEIQMKELDKYIQELGHDITEMIQDASPEEKQMLQQKISALATKIK